MIKRGIMIVVLLGLSYAELSCLPSFHYQMKSGEYRGVDKYDHEYELVSDSVTLRISAFVHGSFQPLPQRPLFVWVKLTNQAGSVATYTPREIHLVSSLRSYPLETVRFGHQTFKVGKVIPRDTLLYLTSRQIVGIQLTFTPQADDTLQDFRNELGRLHFENGNDTRLRPALFVFQKKQSIATFRDTVLVRT